MAGGCRLSSFEEIADGPYATDHETRQDHGEPHGKRIPDRDRIGCRTVRVDATSDQVLKLADALDDLLADEETERQAASS
jgi:hypothetical protein